MPMFDIYMVAANMWQLSRLGALQPGHDEQHRELMQRMCMQCQPQLQGATSRTLLNLTDALGRLGTQASQLYRLTSMSGACCMAYESLSCISKAKLAGPILQAL